MWGDVFSKSSNDQSRDQSKQRTDERMNGLSVSNYFFGQSQLEVCRVGKDSSEENSTYQNYGWYYKLILESTLNLFVSINWWAICGDNADNYADYDSEGNDHERVEEIVEVEVAWAVSN